MQCSLVKLSFHHWSLGYLVSSQLASVVFLCAFYLESKDCGQIVGRLSWAAL